MPLTPQQIITRIEYDPNGLERIASRNLTKVLEIVEPDPTWPQQFEQLKTRIKNALGDTALAIAHAGSTSVPDLPAKNIIDIDLTVKDILDEDSYVGPLEAAGFMFLFRERGWHEHRFFGLGRDPTPVNLHVFGPDCPEVERHRIFREWLTNNPGDRERYAEIKRVSARESRERGESVMDYNNRKEKVLQEILDNAFRALGYIE
ncbi:GrpB domain-containing protein [Pochonia chlamydosporia 170]|uniref:GrpB domain-containing protein n=1 Tax=Pochonia chlamydosporia 170 TaxID=1380566 RepID=A0A179EZI2_METCM|nr:GrpB domain-containing protein [Pochonia chlamydosporia 170]OAQ58596.1 GrpB domain-containing protein [Pochonia chlamydosporia 170]